MSYAGHQQDSAGETPRVAVITLSDTRTTETDVSGNLIRTLAAAHGFALVDSLLLPDQPSRLHQALEVWLDRKDIDAILTNGGTGIAQRDLTIHTIEALLDTKLPGFGELFRMLSFEQIGSGAMLSRAVGGVARGKLIFAMPGSPKAVELAMTRLILPELKHLVHELKR